MYINFKIMKSKGLSAKDVVLLQMFKQNRSEDTSEYISWELEGDESSLNSFEEDGLISYVKAKSKKETKFNTVRLSKKGNKILEDLATFQVMEEDMRVYEWLKTRYLEFEKEIGSEKKGLELCAWFRNESGITKNNLIILCRSFMADEEQMKWSLMLQYLFWKPDAHNRYQKPRLENSKLWLYYEKHKDFFEAEFLKQSLKNGNKTES